eukprot:6218726-Amphidinium_carterae.1
MICYGLSVEASCALPLHHGNLGTVAAWCGERYKAVGSRLEEICFSMKGVDGAVQVEWSKCGVFRLLSRHWSHVKHISGAMIKLPEPGLDESFSLVSNHHELKAYAASTSSNCFDTSLLHKMFKKMRVEIPLPMMRYCQREHETLDEPSKKKTCRAQKLEKLQSLNSKPVEEREGVALVTPPKPKHARMQLPKSELPAEVGSAADEESMASGVPLGPGGGAEVVATAS